MNSYSSLASGTAVQYLAEQIGEFNRKIDTLSRDVLVIKQDTVFMKKQLNLLINNLVVDILSIKKEKRDEEEKILLIQSYINESLDRNREYQNSSKIYSRIVSNMIPSWNNLDADSKRFLTSAEYLFSALQKIENADFSPCVLQYSKAVENELFIKLFKPFINKISAKQNLQNLLFKDLENSKTRVFAQQIISGSNNRRLTLGQMVYILSNSNSLNPSYAFQEYFKFISNKTIFKILDNLDYINKSFRRKSAHPEIMDIQKAEDIKKIVPEIISEILLTD